MPDDRTCRTGATGNPGFANNPCPFLRALVANGYVDGHVVPLRHIVQGDRAGEWRDGLMARRRCGSDLAGRRRSPTASAL